MGVPGWLSHLGVCLLISAQVMIFRFVGSNPLSVSGLTVRSPLWDSLPPSLSASKQINKQTLKTETMTDPLIVCSRVPSPDILPHFPRAPRPTRLSDAPFVGCPMLWAVDRMMQIRCPRIAKRNRRSCQRCRIS